ncbi:hypothetical protein BYT27DRAFT_7341037 [Phlegmacium glaucopus]|nr:hypothetical protein BYT27DRAFT_7341037 [Phlegmacium glaucopus]
MTVQRDKGTRRLTQAQFLHSEGEEWDEGSESETEPCFDLAPSNSARRREGILSKTIYIDEVMGRTHQVRTREPPSNYPFVSSHKHLYSSEPLPQPIEWLRWKATVYRTQVVRTMGIKLGRYRSDPQFRSASTSVCSSGPPPIPELDQPPTTNQTIRRPPIQGYIIDSDDHYFSNPNNRTHI